MTAFAQTTDVSATWRTLNAAQTAYASLLLDAAALWIRNKKPGIADGDPAARIVSIQVVRDALQRDVFGGSPSGTRTYGKKTESWTTARTATIAELAQTLVFGPYQLQLLGIFQPTGPRGQFGNARPAVDPIVIAGRSWEQRQ